MKKINIKLWRDISGRKGQFISLIIIVAMGISFWNLMITGFINLNFTLTQVYDENQFAHLNIQTLPGVYLQEDDMLELANQIQTEYSDQIQTIQPRLIIDTKRVFLAKNDWIQLSPRLS